MEVALEKRLDKLEDNMKRILTLLEGSPTMGVAGFGTRLSKLERSISFLYAVMPLAVLGGTAIGKVISDAIL